MDTLIKSYYFPTIFYICKMGLCQGSLSDRMSRLCHKKSPQTVVQYQNIIGMRTSFVSCDSHPQSKSSLSRPAQPSFQSKTQTRKALNDIYNRLDKLSQKFDSVGIKLNLEYDSEEEKDEVEELDDIVYRTHLMPQAKSTKQSAVVFHSQDVSNAVPVRFQKNDRSGTFVNRLNGLQSTVVDRVKPKQNSECFSLQ